VAVGATVRCTCAYCRMRGLMGPLMLIALGAIFVADQFTRFTFGDLWPILLIVAGALKCAASLASRTGHAGV